LVGHASRSMTARSSRQGPPLRLLADAQEKRDWGLVPKSGNTNFTQCPIPPR
jgi:hypothetical protein